MVRLELGKRIKYVYRKQNGNITYSEYFAARGDDGNTYYVVVWCYTDGIGSTYFYGGDWYYCANKRGDIVVRNDGIYFAGEAA